MHSRAFDRHLIALLTSAALLAAAGDASAQAVNAAVEAAPDERVSNVDAAAIPSPGNGAGGGEASFSGAETALASDALAEFAARVASAEETWELASLPPATAPVGVESILFPDERSQVTTTTAYPYRAIVLITFTGGRCTGWMYGPDVVATAGHCVHSGGAAGSWQTNVVVHPGRNGAASPFGSCSAQALHSVIGWTRDRDERHDYGAIKLNCDIGNTTGWFGLWWQGAALDGTGTEISGYPGDKPLENWRSLDQIRVSETDQAFYFNDTLGGMSGSPVFTVRPAGSPWCVGHCALGIHAYGLHGSTPHADHNHGTRFTQRKFENLIFWRNLPAVS